MPGVTPESARSGDYGIRSLAPSRAPQKTRELERFSQIPPQLGRNGAGVIVMTGFWRLVVWNVALATVLAGAVALASCLKVVRHRPGLRHTLWMLVLLKLITPPLIPLPVLPSHPVESSMILTDDLRVSPWVGVSRHSPPRPAFAYASRSHRTGCPRSSVCPDVGRPRLAARSGFYSRQGNFLGSRPSKGWVDRSALGMSRAQRRVLSRKGRRS